jgi:2-oxoglutarate dehydrogenase E1 component
MATRPSAARHRAETLNLSQLEGYKVGGTLHGGQQPDWFHDRPVGSGAAPTRPTWPRYFAAPIFHVNGEDPEAVAQCVRLALTSAAISRDVVIDMYCRRRGGPQRRRRALVYAAQLYKAIRIGVGAHGISTTYSSSAA